MLTLNVYEQKEQWIREETKLQQTYSELLERVQEGEKRYTDSLGWLDTEKWASGKEWKRLETLASKIRQRADVFVLIGVGGSNNAARSVIEALKSDFGKHEGKDHLTQIVYAGNTLSAYALKELMESLDGKSVYINCIAKNFETLEPGVSFRVLRQYLYKTYGDQAAERIICTGSKGSTLEVLCVQEGYTFLEFPADVGGRYTAITGVGLLPMAVAGIDIARVVKGAQDMQKVLRETKRAQNPAYRYACLRNLYYQNGYRIEMLSSFEPKLRWFYKWWIQLFAESEGKENRGIFPVSGEFSEELHSIGQFLQDGSPMIFETFVHVKNRQASFVISPDEKKDYFDYLDGKDLHDINEAAFEATCQAHSEKLPCLVLEIDEIDAYHFGQMFYFFEFACALSCEMMGVNPFDQPGVEAYKERMFRTLGKGGKQNE